MNPGPGFGGGIGGLGGIAIGQTVVTLLVLGGVVAFGVLVLRRLGAIERAVRGETPSAARSHVVPAVPHPADADARAWQQAPTAHPADGDARAWQQQAPTVEAPSTPQVPSAQPEPQAQTTARSS